MGPDLAPAMCSVAEPKPTPKPAAPSGDRAGVAARRLAVEALVRVDEGAFANLVVPALLARSRLPARDRALVTDLVYGTTRMRRACDHVAAPFLRRRLDSPVQAAVRLGVYQLVYLATPPHAAVSATAGAVDGPARGLVNAVLRRVAGAGTPVFPNDATRLSYPDWIHDRLVADLGASDAVAAMQIMNQPPAVHTRSDGYVQDRASQAVAEQVGAQAGDRVLDMCAGPGGKATWMAHAGADVVATDAQAHRARLVADNARTTDARTVHCAVADGTRPPFPDGRFDRVLVDAPCSGLGVLRRRADARWRVQPGDIDDLAELQRKLLGSAAALVRPGGVLVYSACTVTRAETAGQDRWLSVAHPDLVPLPPPVGWRPAGRGGLVLPHDRGTDGMFVLTLRRSAS